MNTNAEILLSMGGILMIGLFADLVGRKTPLPRVTLLLLAGIAIGPRGLDLIPELFQEYFELIANLALLMVGFLVGGGLTWRAFQAAGRSMFWISVLAALGVVVLAIPGLWLLGVSIEEAILLGCLASATDPAATIDVILESHKKSRFGDLIAGVTALDDAWALILFSLGISVISALQGAQSLLAPLWIAGRDIGGGVLVGLLLGLPGAYLTGRLKRGQPMLVEALGLVFLCGGLALWLEVSFLIAAMVMGATIANLARHHQFAFHQIEDIEWPFMVLFFILAGALLDLASLITLGTIGLAYIVLRSAGKIGGAWLGGRLAGEPAAVQRWAGLALLPQAGAAMGMALVAMNRFPGLHQMILTIVIATTVFFEIVGPVMGRLALRKTA